jgi:hypothetical protein
MARLLLIGAFAPLGVGAITGLGLHAIDASGEVGGIAFVLAACVAGLIGAAVSLRMPPSRRQQQSIRPLEENGWPPSLSKSKAL